MNMIIYILISINAWMFLFSACSFMSSTLGLSLRKLRTNSLACVPDACQTSCWLVVPNVSKRLLLSTTNQ